MMVRRASADLIWENETVPIEQRLAVPLPGPAPTIDVLFYESGDAGTSPFWSPCNQLVPLCVMSSRSTPLPRGLECPSILRLRGILLSGWAAFCLSVCPCVHPLTLWLLLRLGCCEHGCVHVFALRSYFPLLHIYWEVKFLEHVGILQFWGESLCCGHTHSCFHQQSPGHSSPPPHSRCFHSSIDQSVF